MGSLGILCAHRELVITTGRGQRGEGAGAAEAADGPDGAEAKKLAGTRSGARKKERKSSKSFLKNPAYG